MIDLYTSHTANGYKCSIALEELELDYNVIKINIFELEQKSPGFLTLNPNGRIPVIVDRENDDFVVIESGAILLYLAEKTGQLLPRDPNGRSSVIQWVMFQMAGIGPMHGQAGVFSNYFPTKHADVIARFRNESRRLYTVVDTVLARRPWLAGDTYSIADICTFTWSLQWEYAGIDISDLNHLKRWQDKILARPAVQRGLASPGTGDMTWEDVLAKAPNMVTR